MGDGAEGSGDRDPLSAAVIGAAITVHRTLGPGLLESAYESCLCRELELQKIPHARQVPLPVEYKGARLDCGYRLDLVVDDRLVVELKTVSNFEPIHTAQMLTYLRLSGFRTGLLINFHAPTLRRGLKRFQL